MVTVGYVDYQVSIYSNGEIYLYMLG
jgi:hypothetical protein